VLPVVLTFGFHLVETIPARDLHQVVDQLASHTLPEYRAHPEDAEYSPVDSRVHTLTVELHPPIGALGGATVRATNSRAA
jgi:hypothetical protein